MNNVPSGKPRIRPAAAGERCHGVAGATWYAPTRWCAFAARFTLRGYGYCIRHLEIAIRHEASR